MTHAQDPLVIAVDGGGSNCRACLYEMSGKVLGKALGRAANITTDFEESRRNVESTIRHAYGDAGLSPSRIPSDIACLGLAGANAGEGAKKLEQLLNFSRVRVVSDRDVTVQGALGGGDGAVAQVGTGSFFTVRSNGVFRHAGGWGFQLSDDCSGAWLGRSLLRATVEAYDGLADGSPLTGAILDRFGGTPRKLVMYIQSATPSEYGSFVPELVAARDDGDPVACAIFQGAVDRMTFILDKLDAPRAGRLCLMGGVGPAYASLLPARYRELMVEPLGNALDGAFALACSELMEAGK